MSHAIDALTLYTVGHSNQTPDAFVTLLQQHRIGTLVDVRSAPYSRWVPHFNKNALEALLPEHQIEYRYAGKHLGGRPSDISLYKDQNNPDKLVREHYVQKVDYKLVMQQAYFQTGLRHLLRLVRENTQGVVIMCAEAVPFDCHRHHLITRALIDPKCRVVDERVDVHHILPDGTLEVATESVFIDPPQQLGLFD